jgi:hypothetical protein
MRIKNEENIKKIGIGKVNPAVKFALKVKSAYLLGTQISLWQAKAQTCDNFCTRASRTIRADQEERLKKIAGKTGRKLSELVREAVGVSFGSV